MIATYHWHSQAPTTWENLKRYRFEAMLLAAATVLALLIWFHLDRDTPTATDVERSLQSYVQMLRSSRSVNGGSLRMEMQADIIGPRVTGLTIKEQQRFIGYWTIDAVMRVETLTGLPVDVPIRLRVARQNDNWTVLQAEDLSRRAPLRQ
ncbi:MAG TPA: hypothetical protein VM639_11990 [Dongiaceae bacterium]|nr:hypothetical protein [Dongiaceae bacterium]